MRQRLPTFMREGAADTEVTRRVKRYVNSIDKFRFGHTVVFSVTFTEDTSCCSVPSWTPVYAVVHWQMHSIGWQDCVCGYFCIFCITPSHRHMDSEIFHLLVFCRGSSNLCSLSFSFDGTAAVMLFCNLKDKTLASLGFLEKKEGGRHIMMLLF